MSPPTPPPDLQRLRRRFVTLMIVQGLLLVAALAFAVTYFALRQAWGLPAFAAALAIALAAQVRFIWKFRNGGS
jgi:hypothetical protein